MGSPATALNLGRDGLVEKARHGFVVSHVAARTLAVAQLNRSGSDLMAIVAPQCGDVKWVNQVAQRRIALLLKQKSSFRKSISLRARVVSRPFGNENTGVLQQAPRVRGHRRWNPFAGTQSFYDGL